MNEMQRKFLERALRERNAKKLKICRKCNSEKADHYEAEGAYLRRICPLCCSCDETMRDE